MIITHWNKLALNDVMNGEIVTDETGELSVYVCGHQLIIKLGNVKQIFHVESAPNKFLRFAFEVARK